MFQTSNIKDKASQITDYWSPQVIAKLDNYYVKLARLKGQLTWHNHADQDEMFLIIKGTLRMQYQGHFVELTEGDVHIVPKGIEHNPIAEEECLVLLIEHVSTLHTGDALVHGTKEILQQLRQIEQDLNQV